MKKMHYLKYSFLLILLAISLPTLTKELTCTKYKKFPIVLNVCEGEGPCGNLESNHALLPVDIHQKPSKHSKIVDKLEKGDVIKNTEPYLIIKKFGKVKVLDSKKELYALGVRDGDILPFVNYLEESLEACIDNHLIEVESLYNDNPEISFVKILEDNKTEDWVKLRTPRNIVGFAPDISDENSVQWYRDRRS